MLLSTDFNENIEIYGIQIKKLDAFFNFFLQKYPFGECVFFEIIYNIIIEDISMPIERKKE